MKLTREYLTELIGQSATEKLLSAHQHVYAQISPTGDTFAPVQWSAREPWNGTSLSIELPQGWMILPVAQDAQAMVVDAVTQAELERALLGVRIEEGEIVEVWVVA
ncbi:hypothetical protein [Deinococcus misasensis]|uniref:hypothetical protein n=1 Tax=Deinococcus misasensis TaxID=392413 RepID=UPI0005555C9F|nr:hypothetical protein [Deinococcus misasensis]